MKTSINIQYKITLLASLCLVTVVGLLVGLSLQQNAASTEQVKQDASHMLVEAGRQNLHAQARLQAVQVQQGFNHAYEFGLGLERQITYLRQRIARADISAVTARQDLVSELRQAITDRPELLGLFVTFQPDALDGNDAAFVGQNALGSNDSGRFALYWLQPRAGQLQAVPGDERLLADTTPGPSGAPFNAFFTCPLHTARPCLVDPYFDDSSGTRRLVASITLPLLENGKVIAVIGMDISLESLQQDASAASAALYGGKSAISVISPTGVVAADSAQAQRLGKRLDEFMPSHAAQIIEWLQRSETREFDDGQRMSLLVPIEPIANAPSWGVLVSVPQDVLAEPAEALKARMDQTRVNSSVLGLTLGSVAALLGIAMMWLAARSITRPLLRVAHMLEDIADGEGDLTRRIGYTHKDELGRVATAFNRFLDKLQPVVAKVQHAVGDTRDTADRSAAIARLTSTGMQQQFREIDQVATALHEMSATANTAAHSAAQAADAARRAEHATGEGLRVIQQTTRAIEALAQDMNQGMEHLHALSQSSEQIGSVLEVIMSIAGQTNLLALNAAIEAARAGEAGRGFAVVADEVRSLARRTQHSVEEIRQVIQSLQGGTQSVSQAMQGSHELAQGNAGQARQALAALEQIGLAVNEISDMNLQIASAAEEQSSVAEEINRNVETIRDVTQSLSSQAQQAAGVSDQLNAQANHQQGLIGQFKA